MLDSGAQDIQIPEQLVVAPLFCKGTCGHLQLLGKLVRAHALLFLLPSWEADWLPDSCGFLAFPDGGLPWPSLAR